MKSLIFPIQLLMPIPLVTLVSTRIETFQSTTRLTTINIKIKTKGQVSSTLHKALALLWHSQVPKHQVINNFEFFYETNILWTVYDVHVHWDMIFQRMILFWYKKNI